MGSSRVSDQGSHSWAPPLGRRNPQSRTDTGLVALGGAGWATWYGAGLRPFGADGGAEAPGPAEEDVSHPAPRGAGRARGGEPGAWPGAGRAVRELDICIL